MTTTIEIQGTSYSATVDGESVTIARDGVLVGKGRWAADRGVIEDCSAVLDDAVYAALDAALDAALAA